MKESNSLFLKSASYAICYNDEGKVLLMRRFKTGYMDGFYTLPAGHIEAGEDPIGACVRELYEETGLIAGVDSSKLVHSQFRVCSSPSLTYVDYFIVVPNYSGVLKNMEPDKCDDMAWFDKSSLPEKVLPNVLECLKHIDNRQTLSIRYE